MIDWAERRDNTPCDCMVDSKAIEAETIERCAVEVDKWKGIDGYAARIASRIRELKRSASEHK